MGMFDELTCKYPLPVEGANAHLYQTKDMDCFLGLYEIREDGTLWHERYNTEDQSDAAKWEREHPGEEAPDTLDGFCGCMTRVNKRWVQEENFTGEICFYTSLRPGWIEWSAYFVKGKLKELHLISHDLGDDSAKTADPKVDEKGAVPEAGSSSEPGVRPE